MKKEREVFVSKLDAQKEIGYVKLKAAWDIRTASPNLFSKLVSKEKNLPKILNSWMSATPIAKTVAAFDGSNFFRPTGHARSIYFQNLKSGCIALKGTEPMTDDYTKAFREGLNRVPQDSYSKMDWFVMFESEVYLAVTLDGALSCAKNSLAWNETYFRCYKQFPKTPLPLLVLKLEDEVSSIFFKKLRPFLTDRPQYSSVERCKELVAGGLGVYIYYLPGSPLRAAHALNWFPGSGGVGTSKGSSQNLKFKIEDSAEHWITVIAEMLVAGYMPTTRVHCGNCVQLQNLTIDGGICDLDSLEPMHKIKNDKAFEGALFYSLNTLIADLSMGLSLNLEWSSGVLWIYFWNAIRKKVLLKSRRHKCDPRLLRIFKENEASIFGRLIENSRQSTHIKGE